MFLRALIVEDSEDDAVLLVRELTKAGFELVHRRVETAEAMSNAARCRNVGHRPYRLRTSPIQRCGRIAACARTGRRFFR